MRQGVTLPETPKERRDLAALAADLEDSPVLGEALPLRLRNFRPSSEKYLASLSGPLAYMVRLRDIDRLTAKLEAELEDAWHELAVECAGDEVRFERHWRERTAAVVFVEVNDLIERHNRWYPAESRLPMDPVRRDYALVNGRDYRRRLLDEEWVLERFPARLELAEHGRQTG